MTNTPYQVMFLADEKSVGTINFVRRNPEQCKLNGSMIRHVTTWRMFRSQFGRFIVLGLMQLFWGVSCSGQVVFFSYRLCT